MTIGSGLVGAVRCAAWARAEGLDPIGSAGSYRGFLLLEVPLPWPRDVSEMPEVAAVADLLAGRGLRVQALVPAGAGPRRAIAYLNPTADHFSGFARREVVCGSDLRGTLTALLAAPAGAGRDLLVCTHGGRDVCCGSRGMDLAMRLGDIDMPDGLERWRTSHTGGHRFAPTFVVLPEGTAWAYADTDLVDRVLRRRGDCADVLDRYRGCAGLGGPAVQALEREVLRGWDGRCWTSPGGVRPAPTGRLGCSSTIRPAESTSGRAASSRAVTCRYPTVASRSRPPRSRRPSGWSPTFAGDDPTSRGGARPGLAHWTVTVSRSGGRGRALDPVEEGRDSAGQGAG